MDILSIVGAVLRRWYIAVPIGIVALVLGLVVQSTTPAQYQASGSALLANPELDPSRLPLTPAMLSEVIDAVQEGAAAGDFGSTDSAEIYALDATTVAIEVGASSESAASDATDAIAEAFSERLAAAQEANEVPPEDRAEVFPRGTEVVGADEQEGTSDAAVTASAILQINDPTAGIANPFGASAETVRVLEVALESDEGRLQVAERAQRPVAFDIAQETRDVAPIVQITTFGASPERVLEDFELVVDVLGEELDARQARAQLPESRRVVLEMLATPQNVADISPPVSRAAAVVVGLGGLLGVGAALLTDSIASRRRGRSDGQLGGGWDLEADFPSEPTTSGPSSSSRPAQTSRPAP